MFYGAEDYDTAFKETVDVRNCRGNSATAGVFVAKRELNILDLCQLPQMHSFFSPWTVSQRHGIYFLRSFQKDLAKPIRKDDRQHIEYVPTQVFTEFMRFEFRSHYSQPTLLRSQDIKPIDGIRYPSSKTGRPCIVLFLEQHDCLSGSPDSKWNPALELDLASVVVHKNLETKE